MRALWQNQTMHRGYFDTTRKGNHSSFPIPTVVCGWCSLSSEICAQISNWPTPFEKRRLRQIFAYNVSTVRDSKIVQLRRTGSRPRAFQRAIDGVHTLPLNPPKGGSESDFFFIKSNFNQIKSATKSIMCKRLAANCSITIPSYKGP